MIPFELGVSLFFAGFSLAFVFVCFIDSRGQ
jgi:hypothetical protein